MATGDRVTPADLDRSAAARGALYQLLARLFDEPDEELHAAMDDGTLGREVASLLDGADLAVDPPALGTDDDHELLCARFNDLFEVGFAVATDRTNGEVEGDGPPVPLYENRYRPDATWDEVNGDLARAFDHFGVTVDEQRREHHDHLRLELEFAGYLARAAAAVDEDAARARRDLLDRHLLPFARGVRSRVDDEPGTGVYDGVAELLVAVVEADLADLRDRYGTADDGRDRAATGNGGGDGP